MLSCFINKQILGVDWQCVRSQWNYYPGPQGDPIQLGFASPNHLRLSDIPGHLLLIILLNEDIGFFQHRGFNFAEFKRRSWAYIKGDGVRASGSSLSQQLSRHLFCTMSWGTLIRKFSEAALTVELEATFSKEEILELFLSSVFLGHTRIFGVKEFARKYFNRKVQELTIPESMYLAMAIRSPVRAQIRDLQKKEISRFQFKHAYTKFCDFLLYCHIIAPESSSENQPPITVNKIIELLRQGAASNSTSVSAEMFEKIEQRALHFTAELREIVEHLSMRGDKIIADMS